MVVVRVSFCVAVARDDEEAERAIVGGSCGLASGTVNVVEADHAVRM